MDNHMDNNPNGNRPDNNKGPGRQDPNKNHQSILAFLVCLLVTLVCFAMFTNMLKDNSSEITYDKFIEMVDDGDVKEVTLQSNTLTITPKHQSSGFSEEVYYANQMESVDKLTERLEGTGIKFEYKKPDAAGEIISMLVSVLLPTILLFVLLTVFMRRMNKGGGMMGVGKSRAKAYIQKDTGITFRDVAGQDEAKESLQEVVDFLHNPGKYTTIGAKLPKGALLVGPPGTGKTLLAKAVAGEAHVPFFSLSGSEFVEMFVGVGASRVRDLFEEAKKNAPCIIFIDEIDAIGKSRDSHYGGGNDEREQTLNQLLAEMDGFDTSKGLLILAATNRPEVLDPALLRPGRFDRRVIVDRPDLKGRIEILKVHARNVHLDETVDFENIALATSGAVGSDLANMINEAAILAVKSGRSAVSQKDLLEAVEVVLVGKEKKDRILSAQERRIVSYHEVGHALVSALQKDAEPVQKITIVPRTMGALGYVMQVPEEEKYLNTKKELEEISEVCHKYDLPLFLDGARLGYGLVSPETDVTLEDIARYTDVFYIGGTKVGALCGEAVVFTKKAPKHFMTMVKQQGALLAKGRLLGIQFDTLFTDDLYTKISKNAIETAMKLKKALQEKGYQLYLDSPTNQQFVVLENKKKEELGKKVQFDFWEKYDEDHTVIRFATSWGTKMEDIDALIELL